MNTTTIPRLPLISQRNTIKPYLLSTCRHTLKPLAAYSKGKIEFFLHTERPDKNISVNENMNKKIAPRLAEFKELQRMREGAYQKVSKAFEAELTERIIIKARLILDILGISLNIISSAPKYPGNMINIRPLTKRYELSNILLLMIPEICRIPYSFLQKIHVRTLNFCDEIVVYQRSYLKPVEEKLFSNIVQVEKCDTPRLAIFDIYRIIVQNFIREVPNIKIKWDKLKAKVDDLKLLEKEEYFNRDLINTFIVLMKSLQNKGFDFLEPPNTKLKAMELENHLKKFDPEGFPCIPIRKI